MIREKLPHVGILVSCGPCSSRARIGAVGRRLQHWLSAQEPVADVAEFVDTLGVHCLCITKGTAESMCGAFDEMRSTGGRS